jgi:hypothetical protein
MQDPDRGKIPSSDRQLPVLSALYAKAFTLLSISGKTRFLLQLYHYFTFCQALCDISQKNNLLLCFLTIANI